MDIMEWKDNLRLQTGKEQKVKVYDLIEEKSDTFSSHDEMETFSQVEVPLKLCNKLPFLSVCNKGETKTSYRKKYEFLGNKG